MRASTPDTPPTTSDDPDRDRAADRAADTARADAADGTAAEDHADREARADRESHDEQADAGARAGREGFGARADPGGGGQADDDRDASTDPAPEGPAAVRRKRARRGAPARVTPSATPAPATRTAPARTAPGLLGRVKPVVLAALALAVAAAVAAAWGGWAWYSAAHDGDAAFARTRDTVLAAGEQAVQNMNTLDHSDVDHGLDVWESSTTGDLHSQLVQGRADFVKQVQQAQTVSTAKVLSGAVTELDTRAGKAGVMVALRITVQAPKSRPSVKESRMLGELTRTPAGWKLSALGQAPLGDSAGSSSDSSSGSSTGTATGAGTGTTQPSPGQ